LPLKRSSKHPSPAAPTLPRHSPKKFPAISKADPCAELDLATRLFRYPCSYLIYSEAFDALASEVKTHIYERFRKVLGGEDTSETFAHLSQADLAAILEILTATKTGFAEH